MKTPMNAKTRLAIAAYAGLALYIGLSNFTVDSTVSKIAAPTFTGQDIPAAYLALLPAVVENHGIAPPHVQNAAVTAYVVESHRGWPWRIEDKYGYRYDFFDVATGYTATLTGFPAKSAINIPHLMVNFLGPLSALAILHLSLCLAVRNFRFFDSAYAETQLDG